ncbi:N-alpha-acetyltransferase 30A [Culicoides brevitarsis]|uniref:N-alpha-acetyltransferase 30A n=1 Tax=Culicoides brevitarsis TaxID=469753 RepID=UPI00307C806B
MEVAKSDAVQAPEMKQKKKPKKKKNSKGKNIEEEKCTENGVSEHTEPSALTENIDKLSLKVAQEQPSAPPKQVNGVKKHKEALNSSPTSTQEQVTEPQTQENKPKIEYKEYESELQMPDIMQLIQNDLSEPYSIYTYRYFIHNWPKLCFLAMHEDKCVGAIVCKLDVHKMVRRGYIAMLAVDKDYRKLKIGTTLVQKAIEAILRDNADEVVLETEITNRPALRLYENLGFVRDKRLFHYYLNGVDALRLKLWFR